MALDQNKMAQACQIMAQSVAEIYTVPMDSARRSMMVKALYDQDATWSDPITECSGLDSIEANFASLALVAAGGKLEVNHASFKRDKEAGEGTLWFHGTATYRIRMTPFKMSIRQWSILKFSSTTGQIIEHKDEWSVESLVSNIPVVGSLYKGLFRPSVGLGVNTLLGGYMRFMSKRAIAAAEIAKASSSGKHVTIEDRLESLDDNVFAQVSVQASSEGMGPEDDETVASSEEASADPSSIQEVQAQLQQEIRRYVELKQRNSGSYGGSPPKFSYGTTPPRGGGSPYGSLNSSSGRVRQYASSPPRGGGYSSPSPRQSIELEKENPAGIAIPGAT